MEINLHLEDQKVISEIKTKPSSGYSLSRTLAESEEDRNNLLINFIDINPNVVRNVPFHLIWNEDVITLLARKKQKDLLSLIFKINDYMKTTDVYLEYNLHTKYPFTDDNCILLFGLGNEFLQYIPKELKTLLMLLSLYRTPLI